MKRMTRNLVNDPAQAEVSMDAVDRRIVVATQTGLPLTPRPYHDIAQQLGLAPQDVMARLRRMLQTGVIRRIGLVPNHYALGYRANGMSVWNVPDAYVQDLGCRIGTLDFVSHCYHRPRHLPEWPYNLFAMVHGRSRDEVHAKVTIIAELMKRACSRCNEWSSGSSMRLMRRTLSIAIISASVRGRSRSAW